MKRGHTLLYTGGSEFYCRKSGDYSPVEKKVHFNVNLYAENLRF